MGLANAVSFFLAWQDMMIPMMQGVCLWLLQCVGLLPEGLKAGREGQPYKNADVLFSIDYFAAKACCILLCSNVKNREEISTCSDS